MGIRKFSMCIITGMTAAALAAPVLAGCAGETKNEGTNFKVGVAVYDAGDTHISELVDCFREDAREASGSEMKVTVTVRDSAQSQRIQDRAARELLESGCDVLCVNLVDRTAPTEVINMARDADIPVIFFNRELVEEDLNRWEKLYYVGGDPSECGRLQGELAADLIKNDDTVDKNRDGKIQYVVFEGEQGHQDTIVRTESSVNTLLASGIELEKLSYQTANWNRDQAQNKMAQLIESYGSGIELVLANNDEMCIGAIEAYDASDMTDTNRPVFIGTDGTKDGIQAILDGKMAATVYNDKEQQALAMWELAESLYTGGELKDFSIENGHYIMIPYQKVTAENAASFLERQNEPAEGQ